MIVYINHDVLNSCKIETDYCHTEKLLYSKMGIYKQYKHHYYRMNDTNIDYAKYVYKDNNEVLVQSKLPMLDKKEILTHVYKDSYFVERIVQNYLVNANITFVKEVDNTKYTNQYFKVENLELEDAIIQIFDFIRIL